MHARNFSEMRLRHFAVSIQADCTITTIRRLSGASAMSSRRPTGGATYIQREQKIDAAVALMMTIGRAIVGRGLRKGVDGFLFTNPIFE